MTLKKTVIPAVSIRNLDKFFDGRQILFDVNLTIGTGEVFGFL
jgi:ABC-type multidrug transport system ATPase subunit